MFLEIEKFFNKFQKHYNCPAVACPDESFTAHQEAASRGDRRVSVARGPPLDRNSSDANSPDIQVSGLCLAERTYMVVRPCIEVRPLFQRDVI